MSSAHAEAIYWRCPDIPLSKNEGLRKLLGSSHDIKSVRVGFCYDGSGHGYTSLSGSKQLILIPADVDGSSPDDLLNFLSQNNNLGGLMDLLVEHDTLSVNTIFGHLRGESRISYSLIRPSGLSLSWKLSIFKLSSAHQPIEEISNYSSCNRLGTFKKCLPPGEEPEPIDVIQDVHNKEVFARIPYTFGQEPSHN